MTRLADVLVNYSTRVKLGDLVVLRAYDDGEPLLQALHHATLAAGGNPAVQVMYDWAYYDLVKYGSDAQLNFVNPEHQGVVERADVRILVLAQRNTQVAANLDPAREQRHIRMFKPLTARFMERSASGALRWSLTQLPTEGAAQNAEMNLPEYEDFVYGAGLLDDPDPVGRWRQLAAQQRHWTDWFRGHDHVHLRGKDADLEFSIRTHTFLSATGENNMPDGEIYSSPVEDSVNGWVRFTYPVNVGRNIEGIGFRFHDGKTEHATATKNQAMLLKLVDTDDGSRYLGEWGIGTNHGITRFTNNMLFDEKMQGTFHLAIGASYPETGGENASAIHVDIVCDLRDGEILIDDELVYQKGEFVI